MGYGCVPLSGFLLQFASLSVNIHEGGWSLCLDFFLLVFFGLCDTKWRALYERDRGPRVQHVCACDITVSTDENHTRKHHRMRKRNLQAKMEPRAAKNLDKLVVEPAAMPEKFSQLIPRGSHEISIRSLTFASAIPASVLLYFFPGCFDPEGSWP